MTKANNSRVDIPVNVQKNLERPQRVYDKHVADGKDSPLLILTDIDWSKTGPKIAEAAAKHQEAEEFRRKMEQAYRERDQHVLEINDALRATRDLLKAKFRKFPKMLSDWGFNVDDTPKARKTKS
jgi:uncharacterized protein (DUF2236 family)